MSISKKWGLKSVFWGSFTHCIKGENVGDQGSELLIPCLVPARKYDGRAAFGVSTQFKIKGSAYST